MAVLNPTKQLLLIRKHFCLRRQDFKFLAKTYESALVVKQVKGCCIWNGVGFRPKHGPVLSEEPRGMRVAGNNPVDKQLLAQAVNKRNTRTAKALLEWQIMKRLAG